MFYLIQWAGKNLQEDAQERFGAMENRLNGIAWILVRLAALPYRGGNLVVNGTETVALQSPKKKVNE